MRALEKDGAWSKFVEDWQEASVANFEGEQLAAGKNEVWSVWGKDFVKRISMSKEVESVIALGSVLAINLQDEFAGESLHL